MLQLMFWIPRNTPVTANVANTTGKPMLRTLKYSTALVSTSPSALYIRKIGSAKVCVSARKISPNPKFIQMAIGTSPLIASKRSCP